MKISVKNEIETIMQLPVTVVSATPVTNIVEDSKTVLSFKNRFNQSWSTLLLAFIVASIYILFTYKLPFEKSINDAQVIAVTPVNLIELTNDVRKQHSLNTLDNNPLLNQAAANKVKSIFADQHFSHTGKNNEKFSSWIKSAGYDNYVIVGENLALGYYDQQAMMEAWLNSPKHRDNILSPFFNDIGIAAATGNYHGKNVTIVVQLFGKQNNDQANNVKAIKTANNIR